MPRLFIAVNTFVTARRGRDEWITAGDVAEPGSWVIDAHPGAFMPLEVKWKAPVASAPAPSISATDSPASTASDGVSPPAPDGDDDANAQSPGVSPASLAKHRGGRRPKES